MGLVASLGRPGGNVTGVSMVTVELMRSGLELLHELVPKATVIALLVNPEAWLLSPMRKSGAGGGALARAATARLASPH